MGRLGNDAAGGASSAEVKLAIVALIDPRACAQESAAPAVAFPLEVEGRRDDAEQHAVRSGASNSPAEDSVLEVVMFDAHKAYVDVTPVSLAHPPKVAPLYRAPTWAVASRLKAMGATSNRRGHKEVASGAHEGRRGWCNGGRGSLR